MKRAWNHLTIWVLCALCALGSMGCGSATAQLEPEGVSPSLGEASYAPGSAVEIAFQGSWYPGVVLQVLGPELYEVSYDQWGADWNRTARPNQLRLPGQESAAAAGSETQAVPSNPAEEPSAAPQQSASSEFRRPEQGEPPVDPRIDPSTLRPDPTRLQPGESVYVQWRKHWYPATVLQVDSSRVRIRYDGYGAHWDEWVEPTRMRLTPPPEPAPGGSAKGV